MDQGSEYWFINHAITETLKQKALIISNAVNVGQQRHNSYIWWSNKFMEHHLCESHEFVSSSSKLNVQSMLLPRILDKTL